MYNNIFIRQQVWGWPKCFRKPWFLCTVFVCSFVLAGFLRLKEVYERVSKQDFRQLSIFFYRQPLQLGIL